MPENQEMDYRHKQRFFDRQAAGWDSERAHREALVRARELVQWMDLPEGGTVIEPGCGTGGISALLLEALGNSGRLYGLDLSRKMIEKAVSKSFGPRAFYMQGAAEQLPLAVGVADAVVCFGLFPHLFDKQAALAEFNRILHPHGLLVIAHASGRTFLNRMHAKLGEEVVADMIPDRNRMEKLLSSGGFEVATFSDEADRYLVRALKRRTLP